MDVKIPPLVYTVTVLKEWQNIWCYIAQHTARLGGSHGQTSTIKAIHHACEATWRGWGGDTSP